MCWSVPLIRLGCLCCPVFGLVGFFEGCGDGRAKNGVGNGRSTCARFSPFPRRTASVEASYDVAAGSSPRARACNPGGRCDYRRPLDSGYPISSGIRSRSRSVAPVRLAVARAVRGPSQIVEGSNLAGPDLESSLLPEHDLGIPGAECSDRSASGSLWGCVREA